MHKVQRAIAIVNTWKPEALRIAGEIRAELEARRVSCDIYTYDGISSQNPFDSYDFAITLGGDGTVLFAARHCARKRIPVFPVNLGEFGFIAGIQPSAWKKPLVEYLEGKKHSAERMLLTVRVDRGDSTVFSSDALNDAVISGSGIARIVYLSILFNDQPFGEYKADGVIVASPTGSTAYAAAAGGPILAPDLSALILAPICAFSLSNRPIVLPADGVMKITVMPMRHKTACLTIDGQEVFSLQEGDSVYVQQAPDKIRLIGCDTDVFYSALRSKLNWSGVPVRSDAICAGNEGSDTGVPTRDAASAASEPGTGGVDA